MEAASCRGGSKIGMMDEAQGGSKRGSERLSQTSIRRGRRAGDLAAQPGLSRQDGVPLVRRKLALRQEFLRK